MFNIFLLYALFASVFTISKTALDHSQPIFLVGSRMMIAGLILIGYQVIVNKEKFTYDRTTWSRIFQLAFLNIYLTNVLEFWGLRYLTSFKTCFIYSLSPFLSAFFCYLLFKDTITKKKWLGLLIGFTGFAPILLNHTPGEEVGGHLSFFSWAELAVVGATICSVYGWILLKRLVIDHQLSPLSANGFSMIIGGGIALIHSLLSENWNPIPVSNFSIYLECTLALVIISNLICYNLYGYLLKRYSAPFISFAGLTTPIFAAFFGWIFLSETVTWPFFMSLPLVSLGLLVFDQDELKGTFLKAQNTGVPIPLNEG